MLDLLFFVSAAVHLVAEVRRATKVLYVTKPLTILLVIAIAAVRPTSVSPFYTGAILAGLAFSLAGDVLLMLPTDRFVAGLASFLVAHLFYIAAFVSAAGSGSWSPLLAVPFVALGAAVYGTLLPRLGRLKAPVFLYMLAIMCMAWQALAAWVARGGPGALSALAGACFFVASDMALAFNRFRSPYRGAQLLVMATYFGAQWLIAHSV